MGCPYSKNIPNKRYKANTKNGGIIPAVFDKRQLRVNVGCGRCFYCRMESKAEWVCRLNEHYARDKKRLHWVTFTLSDESYIKLEKRDRNYKKIGYEYDNSIIKTAIRLWRGRMRKAGFKGNDLDYFFISELGQKNTERIHLHGFIWCNISTKKLESIWSYGNVWNHNEHEYTYKSEYMIGYTIKYMHKVDEKHPDYKAKKFISNSIGIGYFEDKRMKTKHRFNGKDTVTTYTIDRTQKDIPLPDYYARKFWSDDERAFLSSLHQDKVVINGQEFKYDDEINIESAKRSMREHSIYMGYPDGKVLDEMFHNSLHKREYLKEERRERLKRKGWDIDKLI